jgi:hypothetical protein
MITSPRFKTGARAYTRDGKVYTVDEAVRGTVYCTASNGAEADFPEVTLFTEAEWAARGDGRRDLSNTRLKQARVYQTAAKIDRAASEKFLTRAEKMFPGLLDFAAFSVAQRVLADNKDDEFIPGLSIVMSRKIFDQATPEARATMLSGLLNTSPETMVSAAALGDNMVKAMVDKGMEGLAEDFEVFCDRPRR